MIDRFCGMHLRARGKDFYASDATGWQIAEVYADKRTYPETPSVEQVFQLWKRRQYRFKLFSIKVLPLHPIMYEDKALACDRALFAAYRATKPGSPEAKKAWKAFTVYSAAQTVSFLLQEGHDIACCKPFAETICKELG